MPHRERLENTERKLKWILRKNEKKITSSTIEFVRELYIT